MAHLESVNVATPVERAFADRTIRTAIGKLPVDGPVHARALGLVGDQVGNSRHHGGRDQAVYAYAREDLAWWADQLGGDPLTAGFFGENLTTVGVDLNRTVVGTRWRIGTTELEVASVRTPCNTFTGWLGAHGFDTTQWARRFTRARRPGPYLRVIGEGELTAGEEIVVVDVPDHGVSVEDMFVALTTDRARLPELAVIADLADVPRQRVEQHLARTGAGSGDLDATARQAPLG
ncbi:MOSC domain-containing protein [Nocardioides sambongensis]|uniref:MOSC domain-containing protein n=1 Tax=Nocardioides sambongensis TaxID=2589074 RepID=UPI00112E43CD|nr:MOSC domain-containing protein [Nocardioides sambongensis]